jgi:hypothetical protein
MKEANRARASKRRKRGQVAAGGEEGDEEEEEEEEEEELVSRRKTARNTSTPKASKGAPGAASHRDAVGGLVGMPVRARAVPLLPAWKLANSMQWVLCWEDLEVTGPTATWVRETLQSTYFTGDYLRKQSAGLFRSQAPQDDVDCEKHWLGSPSVWMARSGR